MRRLVTECLSLDEGDRLLALSEGRGLLAVQHLAEGDVVEGLLLLLQLSRLTLTRDGAHQQLISNSWSFKLTFVEKVKRNRIDLCPSLQ